MNIDGFLDNLKGFFEEKETFFSCEKELAAIEQRRGEAIGEMKRLQLVIQKSIALPLEITYLGKIVSYLFFWRK